MINSCYCISQVLPTPSLEVPQLLFKLLGKLFAGFFLLFISLFSIPEVSGITFPGRSSLQAHGNL